MTTSKAIMKRCAGLPDAELTFPFGEQTAVYKVGGKMFAAVGLDSKPGGATLKCEPEHAAALVHQHIDITPGYHMNKRHWITVIASANLPKGLIEDLIENSYDLVVASLPKNARPK